MLITGKIKDYYDTALGFGGVDKTLVYERFPKLLGQTPYNNFQPDVESKQEKWISELSTFKTDGWFMGVPSITEIHSEEKDMMFIIGFCGKTYLGYMYQKYSYLYSNGFTNFFYGADILKYHTEYYAKLKKNDVKYWSVENQLKRVQSYIDKFHDVENLKLFREHNTPIYFETSNCLVINPILKEFEFYKMFDSFTAFQEIEMFISGVLGRGNREIPKIDEKYRQLQAGMDKWSYRNPDPPKRKQKKLKK